MLSEKFFKTLAISFFTFMILPLSMTIYFSRLENNAYNRDSGESLFAAAKCYHIMEYIDTPSRLPTIGISFPIYIVFNNTTRKRCKANISLYAAGFEKDPTGEMNVMLHRGKNTVVWQISTKQAGDHSISVSSGDEERTVGVTVLANHFFTQKQMEIITGILSMLGSAATLAWWLERRDKKVAD